MGMTSILWVSSDSNGRGGGVGGGKGVGDNGGPGFGQPRSPSPIHAASALSTLGEPAHIRGSDI